MSSIMRWRSAETVLEFVLGCPGPEKGWLDTANLWIGSSHFVNALPVPYPLLETRARRKRPVA